MCFETLFMWESHISKMVEVLTLLIRLWGMTVTSNFTCFVFTNVNIREYNFNEPINYLVIFFELHFYFSILLSKQINYKDISLFYSFPQISSLNTRLPMIANFILVKFLLCLNSTPLIISYLMEPVAG